MREFSWLSVAVCSLLPVSAFAEKRPVTVEDCVRVRRVVATPESGGVKMSPDGKRVAYIVKSVELASNKNDYQMYVRDLDQTDRRDNGRLLVHADSLSGLRWLEDSRRVAVLSQTGPTNEIIFVDANTGAREVQVSRATKIEDYSTNADGAIIAFAVKVPPMSNELHDQRQLRGYSLISAKAEQTGTADESYEIYLARRTSSDEREITKVVNNGPGIQPGSPGKTLFSHRAPNRLGNLSLSPDGNYLTFSYFLYWDQNAVPDSWKRNPYVQWSREFGSLQVLGLYDIETEQLRLATDSPHADDRVFWSEDSRAFFVSAYPPVNDEYWKTMRSDLPHDMNSPMVRRRRYTVDVRTGAVSQVLAGFSQEGDTPVSWTRAEGQMIVRLDEKTYILLIRDGQQWREGSRFTSRASTPSGAVTGNGEILVGVHETTTMPSDLFLERIGSSQTILLTDLNPELREVALGEIEPLEWVNKYGARTTGYLIKPVGYQEGKRYPLAILSYGWTGEFVCDGSPFKTTAFPPQPLAAAGFVVLLANFPDDSKQPTEYPGELGQGYNYIEMIESVVTLLADRGIADPSNVGLIGWSRTSWKTDFLLTHSDVKLTAASSADSGIYNYGSYWLGSEEASSRRRDGWESMLGGSPYGPTFSNWLKYTPAFNAGKVSTPLLMEYIGGNNESGYEFFTALNRQGKPADFYWYPRGEHELDTPFERIASLQRNVDWFRFWMQGYEGKAPDYDPDQYVRWRKLREQQQWNDQMRAKGKDPTVEFLRQTSPGAVVNDAPLAPAAKDFRH